VWVRADVRDCFGSIDERVLRRALGDRADDVVAVLRTLWDEGVRGLPVGPDPSAILANWVLAPVDQAVREAGGSPTRWVDDWLVPVRDLRSGEAVLRAVERSLKRIGLEAHPAKTGVIVTAGRRARIVRGSTPGGRDGVA
jgi:hypothetical protein